MKTMMSRIKRIGWSALLLIGPFVHGQEKNDLGSIELQVIERYKGRIAEAVKISRNADFIDTTTHKLSVRYEVPIQTRQFEFRPKPLKPLTVAKASVSKLPLHHLRVGFGLYGLFTLQGSIASDRSRKKQWGADLDMWSVQNGVGDLAYPSNPHRQMRLSAHMKNILSRGKWALKNKVEGGHEGISYYGLPSSWATNILLPDDAAPERRNYYGLSYAGELKLLKVPGSSSHLRRIGIDYGFFSDDIKSSEHRFSVDQNAVIDLSGQALDLGASADFLRTELPENSFQGLRLYRLGAEPSIQSSYGDLEFTIGVKAGAYGRRSDSLEGGKNGIYLLPDLRAAYSFVPTYFRVFAEWSGDVSLNSFEELVKGNPFISSARMDQQVSRRTWVEGGMEGRIIDHLRFRAYARFTLADQMPLYFRLPGELPNMGMAVLYDDMDIGSLRGELSYKKADWDLSGWIQWDSYDTDSAFAAYHLPEFRLGLSGTYRLNSQMETGLRLTHIGKRTAFRPDPAIKQIANELAGYIDLGLQFKYAYNDYLTAHLNLDNVLGQSYDIWLGYPSVGFMASLSVSYRF